MNSKLKKLIDAIIKIMKEEGISYLNIRRESFWDPETKKIDHSKDYYRISADWDSDLGKEEVR